MALERETSPLEWIAKAFKAISRENSYESLAAALLEAALEYSGAAQGAVLLSEGDELLAKLDASLPREKTKILASCPPRTELRVPAEFAENVLVRQETIVTYGSCTESAAIDPAGCPRGRDTALLYIPLVRRERTIGLLYLQAERKQNAFTQACISVMSMLASQAALSFESLQLFGALRETNMWMIRGQKIGRMGSYRWNTRTLLSRASRECYRIFDIDVDLNPVPFEVFRNRVHPDDLPALEQALAEVINTKAPFSHEYRVVHKDGTILNVVAAGQFDRGPSGDLELEGIITDVTERKAAERALADAQADLAQTARLASLGELAGSIVHEVKQPVTGIIASAAACLRWLAREPAELDEARKSTARIIELASRTNKVVSGLRSLVRDGQLQLDDLQINGVVEDVLLLLKRELERAGVRVKTDFDKSIPNIQGDRVQLQQVVLNLVRNAIDAMIDVTGRDRILTVSSKFVNGQATVTIADTGMGIDPSSKGRLFDALYTTKAEGLGLGLSICQKIIVAHSGRLWAEENTRYGTIFTFSIPLFESTEISGIV